MSNSPNYPNKLLSFKIFFPLIFGFVFFSFTNIVIAATQWVNNPSSCNVSDPTNFPGQNCSPDKICGDSSGIAQCYNTASLLPPAVSATSNTLYSASYPNGGYIINCYATADAAAPFCDNSGAYWCNRSNTCYTTQLRDTICTANTWGTATCGACRTGYGDCNLDGGVCEVQFNVTNYPTGTNNHYGVSCLVEEVRCDSGYYDCDASGVAAGNGCEALRAGACTTGGGLSGTWSCSVDAGGSCTDGGSNYNCVCVPPKQYFETGTKAQYLTADPLLWGVQFGTGRLIQFGNSSNEELFAVNNDGSVELAQITAPSTTTNKLYNVAGSLYWNGTMIGASGGGGWSLTGNAGTDPSVNFIGTTDYQPLVFKTENNERMRLTEDGYFGIGTNTPGALLHVQGGANGPATIMVDSVDGNNNGENASIILRSDVTGGGDYPQILFYGNNDLYGYMMGAPDGFQLYGHGNRGIQFFTNSQQRMRIEPNGRIRINSDGSDSAFVQIGQGEHLSATLSVNSMSGYNAIAGFRDQDGEDIFSAVGRLANNNFSFLMGDVSGVYPNSYNGRTAFLLDQASESYTFGRAQLRFEEGGGNDYVGFLSPDSISTPVIWTLPAADGTNGQVLTTDGFGTLSWTSVGSGGAIGDLQAVTDLGYVTTNPIHFAGGLSTDDLVLYRFSDPAQLSIISENDDAILNLIGSAGGSALRISSNGGMGNYAMFKVWPNGSFNISAGEAEVLWGDSLSGNVGIGTINPNSRLHVDAGTNGEIARFTNADEPHGFGFGSDLYGGESGLYEFSGQRLLIGQPMGNPSILKLGQNIGYGNQNNSNFSFGTNVLTHRLLVQGDTTPGDNLFKVQGGANGGYLSIYTSNDDDRNTTIEWQRELRFNVGITDKKAMVINNTGFVGIGSDNPDRLLHAEIDDMVTNNITYAARFSHVTSGLATSNFGTGLEFELENNGGNNKISGTIASQWASASNNNEDSNMIFSTVVNGTLAERMRLDGDGNLAVGFNGLTGGYRLRVDGKSYFDGGGYSDALVVMNSSFAIPEAQLRVDSDAHNVLLQEKRGNVGIGIDSPKQILHVNKTDGDYRSVAYNLRLSHYSDGLSDPPASGFGAGLEFELDNSARVKKISGSIDSTWWNATNGSEASDLIFKTSYQGNLNEVMRATYLGYVGIGTSSPNSKLVIAGDNTDNKVSLLRLVNPQNVDALNSEIFFEAGGGNGTFWNVNAGGDGGALILLDGESKELAKFTNSGLVVNEKGLPDVGLRVEGDTQTHLLYTDATNDRVGIGTNTPGLRFHVVQSSNAVAAFDRTGNDGTVISIRQDGIEEGSISVSGNTVSYNAFTGSHYTWHEGTIEKGTLVSMTGKNKRLNDNAKSEVLYGIEVTKQINSPKVLGAYLDILESQNELSTSNPALVMAVGNGEVWVADKGENIEAGDYLISSDVPGHAQKMDSNYALNYVVARAAEDINWSEVQEKTVDGVKHKMITVFFDNLVVNTQIVDVIKSNQMLGSKLNLAKMAISEANKIRNQLGGEMKAGSGTQISGMQVGQAIIPSKRSAVDVKFNQSYDSAPIVMLTLASDSNLMRYFVSDVTANGFRLNLYPTQSNDTLFNWQAYPANGVQSDQSNVGEEAILEDLPEYEVPVIVRPPQSVFLPIVPNKEESSLNLNGAEDILYNSGLSILEVGDGLGDEIGDTEDVSDEVSTDDIPAEVIENPITPEDPEVSVEAPVTAEISETPAENLE